MALLGDGMSKNVEVQISADGSDAVNSLDNVVESLGGVHVAAGLAGAALAGLGVVGLAKATSAAADFETAMTEVQKVTSEATVDQLHDDILDLSRRLPVAQEELAGIAEIAGRLGVEGSENIARFTETTSKMAVATNLSAEDAANSFARLSNALGTPITEMENMGSAVNTLSNTVAASSDEIVASMLKAAPAAAQLGISFQDLAAMQATLVASGMQVERAGTRMNRAFTKMSQNSGMVAQALGMTASEFQNIIQNNPSQALQMYLDHLAGIESKTGRVNEATAIFGAGGAKAILTLAQSNDELNESLKTSQESYKEATSLQREFNLASDTFNNKAQILKNRLHEIAIVTGEAVLPAMTMLLEGLIFGIDVFNKANEATDGFIGTWVLFSLVLGGGALAAWGAAAAVGGLTGAVGMLITALGILFSPITLIILAIGALAAAWTTNFMGIRDKTESAIGFITDLMDKFVRWMLNMVDRIPGVDIDVSAIMQKREKMKEAFASLPGEAADAISSAKDEVSSSATAKQVMPTPSQSAIQNLGQQDGTEYAANFSKGATSSSSGQGEGEQKSKFGGDRFLREKADSQFKDLVARINDPDTPLAKKRKLQERMHGIQGELNVPEKSPGSVSTTTSSTPTTVKSGVSGDLQRHVSQFGKAVDKFAAAVEEGKEVVLRVDGEGALAQLVREELERENKRRGRRAENFGTL